MILQLDDVTVHYPGCLAVDRISFTVDSGERVALIGPSGAGKSTLLSVAAGLILPTEGVATTLGVDTRELGRRRHRCVRRQIGIVRQDFALVGSLRVARNVAAGRLGDGGVATAVRVLIRPRDLDGISAELTRVGIGDKLWERTDRLSGGQQQRAAVARMLHQNPTLMLADEPLSALDPARSAAVIEALMSPDARHTVIASLHDAQLALRHSDRIIGVRDGQVAFDTSTASVSADMLDDLYELEERAR